MKNLTITLPEDTFARARVAAAREGKSMSRFVAELLEQRVGHRLTQLEALETFLSGPDMPGAAGLKRDDFYAEREDELLRRHEHHPVSEGPSGSRKAGDRKTLAERSRRA